MLYLLIHPDAANDLRALKLSDPKAAAVIAVRLQELQGNQDLMDRLSQDRFGVLGRDAFNIRALASQVQAGNNLWRMRIFELDSRDRTYRVIYAFIPKKGHYHVLGIMPREIDYVRDDEFIRRVERAYDSVRDGRW